MNFNQEEPLYRLEEPIKINDLLTSCPEFSIKSDDACDHEEDTDITQVFNYDLLEPFCLNENLEPPSDDDEIIDGITNSFPIFRKKMTNLTLDGKIMKLVEKTGCGRVFPEDDGAVWIAYVHYAAYVEYAEYPFDVSRLRHKKPFRLYLGKDEVLIGMEKAIRSMREGEKSKFLVHSDLAFGELGVPPRIPPEATILYDIELYNFCQDNKTDDVDEDKVETIQGRIAQARKCREKGNHKKKHEKNVNDAIRQYRKGICILMTSTFANADEELEVHDELIKLYTNLALCYSAKGDYKKVCSTYNDAMHDCPEKARKRVKLLYSSAKALRVLGSYAEAKRRLRAASKLKPGDKDLLTEMNVLEEAINKHKSFERHACRKMFGFVDADNKTDDPDVDYFLNSVSEDFKTTFQEDLEEFLNNVDKDDEHLDFEFTMAELEYCRKECQKRNISLKVVGHGNKSKIILHKRLL